MGNGNKKYYLIVLAISIATLALVGGIYYWVTRPFSTKPGASSSTSPVPTQQQQKEGLLRQSPIKVPDLLETTKLDTLPNNLSFFIPKDARDISLQSAKFADGKQGYIAELNLDFPFYSTLEFYLNELKTHQWERVFSAYVDRFGLIVGKKDNFGVLIMYTPNNPSDTHIKITFIQNQ
jgi:hypothetical protein